MVPARPGFARDAYDLLLRPVSALLLATFCIVDPAVNARADNRLAPLPPPASRHVDFTAEIQPLLAKHCLRCHGAETQEGGLRLDRKSGALAGGQRGPAVVMGQSANSRLVRFAAGANEEQIVMPPEGERLSAAEIGRLRGWIDQGANWPESAPAARSKSADHWAFMRPRRAKAPAVKDSRWVRNEIDSFVLARLETLGIKPAPEADRTTLIRRVWLDLVGLLPPLDEVGRFVGDPAPDAYERLDRPPPGVTSFRRTLGATLARSGSLRG